MLSKFQLEFTPQLFLSLRDSYGAKAFQTDALAGLTVAIIALPLSMAIAIASHVSPEKGLFTAIIGGFIISALGGSRFQIGGPAGAFIVLVASIVDRHGYDGLILATLMAGIIIFAIGAFRFGNYIKFVPHPVTVGFTAGIAIIIFSSQIKELLGLTLPGLEPASFIPKLISLWQAAPSLNIAAVATALLTIATVIAVRKWLPRWPAFLIAVIFAAVLVQAMHLDIDTITSNFGGIPHGLPAPHLPVFTKSMAFTLLPDAFAIALLGSIESLLSAVVADNMSGTKHNSNTELIAQGIANIACAIFGSIVATGTIARTAANVRAGAHGPVAGMLHAVFLLLFMLVAGPLTGYIPLAALAGILVVVCWGMVDKAELKALLTTTRIQAFVLLSTLLLTVFIDLATGIVVGMALSWLINRPRKPKLLEKMWP